MSVEIFVLRCVWGSGFRHTGRTATMENATIDAEGWGALDFEISLGWCVLDLVGNTFKKNLRRKKEKNI